MRSWSALLFLLATAVCGGEAYARSTVVLGGAASGRYVFTGEREQSIFFEGSPSDGRAEVGGILGLRYLGRRSNLRVGLFAGGVLAVLSEEFRKPMARWELEHHWFVTPHLTLTTTMTGEMEPITLGSVAALRSTGKGGTVWLAGLPTLSMQPALEMELDLNRFHQLVGRVGVDSFILLTGLMSGVYDYEDDDVEEAMGAYLELGYQYSMNRSHAVRALVVGRLMRATTPADDPLTGLVGATVGYTYRLRQLFTLEARLGAGRAFNLPASYLLPVEPLARVEAAWTRRLDRFTVGASYGISEYVYLAGLPMRVIRANARYTRAPSWRRLRGVAEVSYEYNRFAHGTKTIIENAQHTVGLRGRLYFSLSGGWRLVGEAAGRVGFLDQGHPDLGYYATALVGIAYLHMRRPRDEALLGDVW